MRVWAPFVVDGGPTVWHVGSATRAGFQRAADPRPPDGTVTIHGTACETRKQRPARVKTVLQRRVQQVYSNQSEQGSALTGVRAGSICRLRRRTASAGGASSACQHSGRPGLSLFHTESVDLVASSRRSGWYFVYPKCGAQPQWSGKTTPPPPDTPMTVEEKLADRYGAAASCSVCAHGLNVR